MSDATVANRRSDSSANVDLIKLVRHGADAFVYLADLSIDGRLAQLLRLRVSQINNCVYCLNLHYEAARYAGIPRPVIDTLSAWSETDFHDDAARAALAYTEAATRVADATVALEFGARHDALARHFSGEEILEIVGVVINMNIWTRLKLAEAPPRFAEQAMSSGRPTARPLCTPASPAWRQMLPSHRLVPATGATGGSKRDAHLVATSRTPHRSHAGPRRRTSRRADPPLGRWRHVIAVLIVAALVVLTAFGVGLAY